MATNISRQRLIPGGLENPNDQYPSSHLFEFMLPLSHLNPISSNDSMLPFPNQKASMCCFDTMLPFSSNEPSVAPMNPIVLTPTPSIPLDGTQVLQERSQEYVIIAKCFQNFWPLKSKQFFSAMIFRDDRRCRWPACFAFVPRLVVTWPVPVPVVFVVARRVDVLTVIRLPSRK